MNLPPQCLAELEAARTARTEKLRGQPAGMQKGDPQLTLLPGGELNEQAIIENTHYECYHCGSKWEDRPSIRQALDESSYYVPTNPRALAENVGFSWPGWINQRLRWGADFMLPYLKALRTDRELGNREDLKQWYQKKAGKTWHDDAGTFIARVIDTAYDPEKPMPGRAADFMLIDCQDQLEHFWFQKWSVDHRANIRLIDRGHVRSWAELAAIQLQGVKIPFNQVFVDGAHKFTEVIAECARHRYIGPITTARGKVIQNAVLTWRVLLGSGKPGFRWPNGRVMRYDSGYKGNGNRYPVTIQHEGRPYTIFVLMNNWSNLAIKDIARRYRDQDNAPKMEVAPQLAHGEGPRAPSTLNPQLSTEDLSFTAQIFSEYRTTERGKPIWKKRTGKVHNHDWDNLCQLLVAMDMHGYLSLDTPPMEAAEETEDTRTLVTT